MELKMTADNERIRRSQRASPRQEVTKPPLAVRSFTSNEELFRDLSVQAGISDTMCLTATSEGISFLMLCLTCMSYVMTLCKAVVKS